jgi:hypothetical protein
VRPSGIHILWPFGIFYGHFGKCFPVLVRCTKKNLATLVPGDVREHEVGRGVRRDRLRVRVRRHLGVGPCRRLPQGGM